MNSHAPAASPIETFDHHSLAFRDERLDTYRFMHEGCPTFRSDRHGGFTFVGNYAQVVQVLRDQAGFSNACITVPPAVLPPIIPAMIDPPMHEPYKRMLNRFFLPQTVETRRPVVRALLTDLLLPGLDRGGCDMVTDVAQPLVAALTMGIMGLSYEDIGDYTRPLHNASLPGVPREEVHAQMDALRERLQADIARARRDPQGIVGELFDIDFQGRRLTDHELLMIVTNLLIGGLGTVPLFMGSAVVFLARSPDHRTQLIEEPDLMRKAIDEMLRVFAPVQTFGRQVVQDGQIGGCPVQAGEMLLLGYGAANMDPAHFADALSVDFTRNARTHLAFGLGPHRCLGSHQAIMIMEEALKMLLSRAPDYRLCEDGVREQTDIATKLGFYNVPIETTPRCA